MRGEEPVFVVTGRKEDVAMAKREILSAAEHFSHIRASRKAGPLASTTPGLSSAPTLPGQTTIQVRVPYRVVGLVVGPKGATIKRIQQQTHTYIVTPSRDKEPVFEVTGMPENVDRAREEIEAHIALRTGSCVDMSTDDNDFHCNGTDVSFETGPCGPWFHSNTVLPSGVHRGSGSGSGTGTGSARITASYRNDSSSSLGSGSSDSFYSGGGNRMADFSPTSPFNSNSSSGSSGGGSGGGSFWFGESSLLPAGSEDLAGLDPPGFDSLPLAAAAATAAAVAPQPSVNPVSMVWNPFEQGIQIFDTRAPSFRDSQPGTPRLSPTFQETLEHPMAQFVQSGYLGSDAHKYPSYGPAFSSSSDSTTSNSPPDHQFCGPTSRGGGLYPLPRE